MKQSVLICLTLLLFGSCNRKMNFDKMNLELNFLSTDESGYFVLFDKSKDDRRTLQKSISQLKQEVQSLKEMHQSSLIYIDFSWDKDYLYIDEMSHYYGDSDDLKVFMKTIRKGENVGYWMSKSRYENSKGLSDFMSQCKGEDCVFDELEKYIYTKHIKEQHNCSNLLVTIDAHKSIEQLSVHYCE